MADGRVAGNAFRQYGQPFGPGIEKKCFHRPVLVAQLYFQVQDALAPGQDRFLLIAGVNQDTIVSVRREGDEFLYGISKEGDGTVPLAFAQLPNVTTYFVEDEHGSLPNNGDVARAVIDLLETGRTRVLKTEWMPSRRGIVHEVRSAELARSTARSALNKIY